MRRAMGVRYLLSVGVIGMTALLLSVRSNNQQHSNNQQRPLSPPPIDVGDYLVGVADLHQSPDVNSPLSLAPSSLVSIFEVTDVGPDIPANWIGVRCVPVAFQYSKNASVVRSGFIQPRADTSVIDLYDDLIRILLKRFKKGDQTDTCRSGGDNCHNSAALLLGSLAIESGNPKTGLHWLDRACEWSRTQNLAGAARSPSLKPHPLVYLRIALACRADAHLRAGRASLATSDLLELQACMRRQPAPNPYCFELLASLWFEAGDMDRSIHVAQQYTDHWPKSSQSWHYLGSLLCRKAESYPGDKHRTARQSALCQATAAYQHATLLAPDDLTHQEYLADLYMESGSANKAQDVAERMLEVSGGKRGWEQLADASYILGDSQRAKLECEQGLVAQPTSARLRELLSVLLYEEAKYAEALLTLEPVLSTRGESVPSPSARLVAATCQFKLNGNSQQYSHQLNALVEQCPDHGGVWLAAAKHWHNLQQFPRALQCLGKYFEVNTELFPKNAATARALAGVSHFNLGEYEQSLVHLDAYLAQIDWDPELPNRRAAYLAKISALRHLSQDADAVRAAEAWLEHVLSEPQLRANFAKEAEWLRDQLRTEMRTAAAEAETATR